MFIVSGLQKPIRALALHFPAVANPLPGYIVGGRPAPAARMAGSSSPQRALRKTEGIVSFGSRNSKRMCGGKSIDRVQVVGCISRKRMWRKRPLGIPADRHRVVQTAVFLLLFPIFEADFHENSYAYRAKRRAHQAIDASKIAFAQREKRSGARRFERLLRPHSSRRIDAACFFEAFRICAIASDIFFKIRVE